MKTLVFNMLPYKLVIVGAVRDVSKYADAVFSNIDNISSLFEKTQIVIVESNSSDDTVQRYKSEEAKRSNMDFVSLGHDPDIQRTNRIANARNKYLDIIREKYSDYDYILVMDMDDKGSYPIFEDDVLSNFHCDVDWNMICANQPDMYYDLWALRHSTLMPYDCWHKVWGRPHWMSYEQAVHMFVNSKYTHIDETVPPFEVESAFGGAAFIKMKALHQFIKHSGTVNGKPMCEWVPFCKSIGKVFINPRFVNLRSANPIVEYKVVTVRQSGEIEVLFMG